jgi:uncharacterized circularly permuted ATP-grasp superfamily protein
MKKLCKDCKHYKDSVWCKAPSNGTSLVSGEYIARIASANRSSSTNVYSDNLCSPSGVYFVSSDRDVSNKKWFQFWKK